VMEITAIDEQTNWRMSPIDECCTKHLAGRHSRTCSRDLRFIFDNLLNDEGRTAAKEA
jgi:hypothetical protein